MRRLIAAFFSALIAVSASAAQEPQQRILLDTITVASDGKFEAAPDTAVINFMIGAQDSDSEGAYKKAQNAAERMRQILKANGIDPKTAELSSYSLQPMYDYRSPKRRLTGYRVTSSVTVKLKDFTKAGPILTQLSAIEETENQSLGYALENMEAAKQKAIEDAFKKARASAETVAKAGQRTLTELVYASVDSYEQPPVMPMVAMKAMRAEAADSAQSAPTEGFGEGKIEVRARVSAIFRLR